MIPGAVVVPRPWAVRRLLDIDASGTVTSTHVRIIVEAAGVFERTMWRWLREARGGRLEARSRKNGFTLSDPAWAELARPGGNVSALRRTMPGTKCRWHARRMGHILGAVAEHVAEGHPP
ncbi:hypothetical protein OG948_01430 [Embleya sp. NBC_00888]|uniref:hypothetical protein n=1 Tax=Embleya sp. NBC_00888 TaxID=2975960 RepID=UPI00386F5B92|nr:hypothetical protein OG948_01430 [Embleya sp. NBC_00888]